MEGDYLITRFQDTFLSEQIKAWNLNNMYHQLALKRASLVAQLVKNPPAMQESESEVAQSCVTLCDPMDPPSVELSRQAYWSGLPFSSRGDLPNPGIQPGSPALQAGNFTV